MNVSDKNLRLLLLSGALTLTSGILALLVLFHRPLQPDGDAVLGTPQLVLFETERCDWCEDFRVKVGRPYNGTEYAGRAPLKYISVDDGPPPKRYRLRDDVRKAALIIFDQYGREIDRFDSEPKTADAVVTMVRKGLRVVPKT